MSGKTGIVDRRTFLKQSAALGAAATSPLPLRFWAEPGPARPDYALTSVPLMDVEVTDEFWSPRIETVRTVSLPILLDREARGNRYIDSRVIEAAAYFIAKRPDKQLQERAESLFALQDAMVRSQLGKWSNRGDGPFLGIGHFFEAAIAYQQATGDSQLLNLAIEAADDLSRQYGPGKRTDISNHEGIELALVKLYRATGDAKYLRLAKFIFDVRGTTQGGRTKTGTYAQDYEPVIDQPRAIGHCVRATYLYCALTDLAALTQQTAYRSAALRIWEDAASRRTYVTGGIGSYRRMEDYGDDYDLPNASCWNEICAAVGNTLWNDRMLLLDRDSRYADMMEKVLYNGLLAGVSQDGDTFLYQTPLKAFTGFTRQAAFGPNCCPPNITRLLAQLGTLIYARDKNSLYVNLFVGSKARFEFDGRQVLVEQTTKYPWEGLIRVQINPSAPVHFALNVRVPGWARNEAAPGNLYHFDGSERQEWTLTVNGKNVPAEMKQGFACIERQWSKNDVVEFVLPMKVQKVRADDRVADDRGMVALQQGPIMFCGEALDNDRGVFNLVVPEEANLQFAYQPSLLGGLGTVRGQVLSLNRDQATAEIRKSDASLMAIPYFALANRGTTEMAVWLARDERRATVPPATTIGSASIASSSCGEGTVADNYPGHKPPTPAERWYPNSQDGSGHIRVISDQQVPVSSADGSAQFLRLRPQSGDTAWVQYDFANPSVVTAASVYWKDDKQFCLLPERWRLYSRDGEAWKPVDAKGDFGIERDAPNRVQFSPVRTDGLRLEITLREAVYKKGELGPPDANYLGEDVTWYEAGIIRWAVESDSPESANVFLSHEAAQDHALNPDPDSDFWKPAQSIILDRNILDEPDPDVRSQARSRWTKDNLYFLFWGPYQTLHLKPDPDTVHETFKLWFYDDFELYLGSNFDNINLYGEFQISPQSEFLDQAIDASVEKPGWGNEHLWDSGMTVKSRIDAEQKIWYGEMCIPIQAIDKRPTAVGNEFRVNVYRLQSAGEGKRIHFLAWQPTGEWNPHKPKKFGTLRLAGQS